MKRSQKFLTVSAEQLKDWAKENPKTVKRILELLNSIDQTSF
jgi:Txe/YoeB family toxin of Txe-Axe toxin-antitoxin module